MSTFKFLHAADIHLDSPLRGLRSRDEDAAQLFAAASRKAFSNLVDAALETSAAFVIIAGDLYDGDWRDYSTGQFFVREAARLVREGVRVFLVRGNHDAASEITRALPLPSGIHEFSVRKVESVEIPELNTVIHGRGFAHRHIAENFALDYPDAKPGWFNVGILHTSLTGREGHDVYAPCSPDDLLRTGYQYWALGHIHTREVVNADPPIVFPGNLQGRHARETGPKGATLVSVEDGRIVELEALVLDAARFESAEVDLTGCANERDWYDAVRAAAGQLIADCEGRPLALRLRLTGGTSLHARLSGDREHLVETLQSVVYELSDRVFIEKIELRTSPADAQSAAVDLPLPIADLDAALTAVTTDADFRDRLEQHLSAIVAKSPAEARTLLPGGSEIDMDSALSLARDLVLSRLTGSPISIGQARASDADDESGEASA